MIKKKQRGSFLFFYSLPTVATKLVRTKFDIMVSGYCIILFQISLTTL